MIHILHKQGHSKKAIAKQLGLSINTVRKYIRNGCEPAYSPRPVTKPVKLEPYKDYIQKRLKEASPHWVPASVIGREIKALGYCGGSTQLRGYMQTLKPKQALTTLRYETEPGYQMQVDWAEFTRKPRLSAFIATLGYSRACYVEFVTDEKLETLLRCHEQAFDYFGGIPYSVLYDNMKTVIIERNAYGAGQHRFQAGFCDYAKHRGFIPKLCKPYRPQTKGKVGTPGKVWLS